jgi:sodium-dependent dicarboxylate transporter 2/3/5
LLKTKNIGLVLGPALFVLVQFILPIDGLSVEGKAVLATTLWVGIWWVTEAIPIEATSLLPIILFPITGALGMKATTVPYANPLIFLFLGGFMIALAIEKWNLHKRIALNIIVFIGTEPSKIILGFMVATGFLSMWISNTATTLMMIPIGISVVSHVAEKEKFAKALMLSIAYSASIGGMATLIGTPPNIVFAGIVRDTFQVEVDFVDWMMLALPFSILLIGISWYVIAKVVYPIKDAGNPGIDEIKLKLSELGKISTEEKRVLIVFTLTAIAWISRSFILNKFIPGINDTMIGMAGGLSLFLLPSSNQGERLIDWSIMKKVPWGILILFGGGLSIANGFVNTDLSQWIGLQFNYLNGLELIILIIAVVAMVNFLTEITSNIATASMILPILAALAISIDIHPYSLMVGAILAASCAFMLPVATAPNAIVFGSGYIKMKDMIRTGIWLNIISIVLISIFVYWIMPLFWNLELTELPINFLPK